MNAFDARQIMADLGVLSVSVRSGVSSKTMDFFTRDIRVAKRVATEFEFLRVDGVRPNGGPHVIYYLKNLPSDAASSFLARIGISAQEFVPGTGMQHWVAPAGAIPTPA